MSNQTEALELADELQELLADDDPDGDKLEVALSDLLPRIRGFLRQFPAEESQAEPKEYSKAFEVHIAGPDDVIQFSDELAAYRHANAINKAYLADRAKNPDNEVLYIATVHGIKDASE